MKALRIHPDDDVLVALADLAAGEAVSDGDDTFPAVEPVARKHKVARRALAEGEPVRMYGVQVGVARAPIPRGAAITVGNLLHATGALRPRRAAPPWSLAPADRLGGVRFEGYPRGDGRVGTANLWLVVPMVFCENRKLLAMRDALTTELGYGQAGAWRARTRAMVERMRAGGAAREALDEVRVDAPSDAARRVFPHVDGVRFLAHEMGCGGTPDDARALASLLAACIDHPNVAGATVLSLGCQHAQVSMLTEALRARGSTRPVHVFEQQRDGSEDAVLGRAIAQTLEGLREADRARRAPAPLSALTVGVKCGASDGFSGISANPVVGRASDLLVGAGGSVVLGEFPELCGVEQWLVDRCVDDAKAERFVGLMRAFRRRLQTVGADFSDNPSPGNIRDGLITDAMKSAGAARKGGSSPVVDVLDYAEPVRAPGLNLVCSPGHDVESVTALAASGATLVVFTTGLGTAVGSALCPVVKVSSHSDLAARRADIIDFDAGPVLDGSASVEALGASLLARLVEVASGRVVTRAEALGQEDFMPWKRGFSL